MCQQMTSLTREDYVHVDLTRRWTLRAVVTPLRVASLEVHFRMEL
jgi:hypothetical protein